MNGYKWYKSLIFVVEIIRYSSALYCSDNNLPIEVECVTKENKEYFISTDKKSFSDAQSDCKARSGMLVELITREEVKFMRELLQRRANLGHFKLGCSVAGHDRKWIWNSSGLPINNPDWFPGEPNNSGGKEHCCAMSSYYLYKWNDDGCNDLTRYICQGTLQACTPGKYGKLCNKTCSGNCDGPCDRKSGVCLTRYEGSSCVKESTDKSWITAVVVGVTVNFITVGIGIFGFCIYRRRNLQYQNKKPTDDQVNKTYTSTIDRKNEQTLEVSYNELSVRHWHSSDVRKHHDPFNVLVMKEQEKWSDAKKLQVHDNDAFNHEGIYHEVDSMKVKNTIMTPQTTCNEYEDMNGNR